ncbi:MAG TPA: response regulator [Terrimicrobiaceae bacterium]
MVAAEQVLPGGAAMQPPPEMFPSQPGVLLVDDDARNLFALESLLQSENYAIATAQTGNEALLALMNREFAAIILDVAMPEVNGIELARLIKQHRRTQHIPIIFLTAHYLEDQDAVLAYDVGAVDYLTKPINPVVLKSKVNVFVDLFRKTRALAAINATLEAQNSALQREAEERMRRIRAEAARAEAEAANAAKDRFLAMLSHELRTPLTPIIYAVALLEKDPDCTAHIREATETIRRNVAAETRLIDDLLDLARIRSGKLTLETESTDAHAILREAMDICFAGTDQDVPKRVEEIRAENSWLEADPARLRQVFCNVLSNAVKFTPVSGTVVIRTANSGNWLRVEVSDTGAGIEPEKLGRIFDAFEQAATGTSAGLGLGLAICKALVELHGGSIEAHSAGPGTGASFIVKLPCSGFFQSEKLSDPAAASRVGPLRILLVDDHADTVESLSSLLAQDGHEVRTAATVAQALDIAKTYAFDILISDIGLPDGQGTELLARLKGTSNPEPLGIALSGFGMEDDRERSRKAGFAEHLTKPVDFAVLQQAITRLADSLK